MKQKKLSKRRPQKRQKDIGHEEASRIVKKYATKQKIQIRLTEDQVNAILKKWKVRNPKMPAEITFYAGVRAIANIKVAGYWYRGDTCCV